MTVRVLVIDDDRRLFELLDEFMGQNAVALDHATDGAAGLLRLSEGGYDAVFLDIMMPGLDGLSVLRRLRERSAVPVIMLTAKGDETDRVVGLELGADDYLPKPFSPRELLARLRAVLRRGAAAPQGARLLLGGLELSEAEREARVGDKRLDLTALEFDLLLALCRRSGRVVPRAALLELAGRGDVHVSERSVDVHVSRIRKKLAELDAHSLSIQTVRGLGYQLSAGKREPGS
ncbi:MAG TPA: response regulator transcription factor [Polyangiaceae bacterium]|nr:response regulator transcription factor [Polyangiaceae bacterium]